MHVCDCMCMCTLEIISLEKNSGIEAIFNPPIIDLNRTGSVCCFGDLYVWFMVYGNYSYNH